MCRTGRRRGAKKKLTLPARSRKGSAGCEWFWRTCLVENGTDRLPG